MISRVVRPPVNQFRFYYYYPPHKPIQRPYVKHHVVKTTLRSRQPAKGVRLKFIRCMQFIEMYFSQSAIHGFAYLVKAGLCWLERVFWFVLLAASVYLCVMIGLQSVYRYNQKSTVIGIERDFYFWNTTLPSLTVCPLQRLSPVLFDEYCRKNDIEGPTKDELMDFLENLANSTYVNFQNIPEYDSIDETLEKLNIKPENYIQLIYNLTNDNTTDPNDKSRIRSIDGRVNIHVRQVLTEYGLCYMANNYLGEEYSSKYLIFGKYPEQNKYELTKKLQQVLQGTFFHKDITLTFIGFTNDAIDIYIHSAYEIMKVDQNFGYTNESVDYIPLSMEMTTDANFEKDVSIAQRKCRFHHESNLTHFPIYTRNICLQECRLNLAYEVCKCIPHFYPNRITNPKPVCDYKILKTCFPPNTKYLLKLYRSKKMLEYISSDQVNNKDVACNCLQNCRDAVVSIKRAQVAKHSKNLVGSIGGTITMQEWPQRRFKRQVIYSFTDLLVSIGGTAGLFLGFSVLGAVEFLYFFTLRVVCYLRGYKI